MAGLRELLASTSGFRLLLDVGSLHVRGKEADIDGITGLHVRDRTRCITTAWESHTPFAILESDE